jgi:hypothetical protein
MNSLGGGVDGHVVAVQVPVVVDVDHWIVLVGVGKELNVCNTVN